MAQVKGRIRFSDGAVMVSSLNVCEAVLNRLAEEILSDLNRFGVWERSQKEYPTSSELVHHYCDTGAFQRFIDHYGTPDLTCVSYFPVPRIYQVFKLSSKKTTKGKKTRPPKDNPNLNKFVQALKQQGYLVFCSGNHNNGLPEQIVVGGNPNADIKDVFYKLAREYKMPYKSGDWYAEA